MLLKIMVVIKKFGQRDLLLREFFFFVDLDPTSFRFTLGRPFLNPFSCLLKSSQIISYRSIQLGESYLCEFLFLFLFAMLLGQWAQILTSITLSSFSPLVPFSLSSRTLSRTRRRSCSRSWRWTGSNLNQTTKIPRLLVSITSFLSLNRRSKNKCQAIFTQRRKANAFLVTEYFFPNR